MKSKTSDPSLLQGSGILQEALEVSPCKQSAATHFIISHGNRLKYIISLNNGISKLKETIAPYNYKLKILLSLLPFIPLEFLAKVGLGCFAQVELHEYIKAHVPNQHEWNILVGTYDSAQKIVFQSFSTLNEPSLFVKVGNQGSANQMEQEIRFLKRAGEYRSFNLPNLRHSELMSEGAPFNIQVTDEFEGEKIPPVLNKEIYQIAKEIAGEPTLIDGIPHTFSHGDFAPWNIRKKGSSYTVFDWEHCGMRPMGYDAAYFIIMSEIALNKRKFDKAFEIASRQLQQFEPDLKLNRELIFREFTRTTKALSY